VVPRAADNGTSLGGGTGTARLVGTVDVTAHGDEEDEDAMVTGRDARDSRSRTLGVIRRRPSTGMMFGEVLSATPGPVAAASP
jgi:hypothetical protein